MAELVTRSGPVRLPAFVPVTTFGRFPLDDLIRPFLPRLAGSVLVSAEGLQGPVAPVGVPLWVDSGGFAALRAEARVEQDGGLGVIVEGSRRLGPAEVLDLQEACADVAFTLDLPARRDAGEVERARRLALTIANARWSLRNRRRADLPLLAVVQGWDPASYADCARQLRDGFDGHAIGGLVPLARDHAAVLEVVRSVRAEVAGPLHVLGIGDPGLFRAVVAAGATSVDSSAFVRLAVDGRTWGGRRVVADPAPLERLHLALANLAAATGAALPLPFAELLQAADWLYGGEG